MEECIILQKMFLNVLLPPNITLLRTNFLTKNMVFITLICPHSGKKDVKSKHRNVIINLHIICTKANAAC